MELDKELKARILLHKVSITKALIVNTYIKKEKASGIVLTDNYLIEQAEKKADNEMARIMQQGMLDTAYNKAWGVIADLLPDNYNIMQERNTLQNK